MCIRDSVVAVASIAVALYRNYGNVEFLSESDAVSHMIACMYDKIYVFQLFVYISYFIQFFVGEMCIRDRAITEYSTRTRSVHT